MLAIVKDRLGDNYTLKDVEKPVPKENEVLIKVKAVGICGTDVPILKGLREVPIPLIPGHEFAGDIVEAGKEVKNFKIGERVTAAIVIGCGHCYYCRKGIEVLCDNISETGIHVDGAFAEYVIVPEKVLHRLPENISYEEGASIDPIASSYHPIKKANIGCEDTVLLFGPGPIGLYAVQIIKAEGARKIIVAGVESDRERLELAKELGADEIIIINKDTDLVEEVKKLTDNRLADIVVDATGSPVVFDNAIKTVRGHGQIILIGLTHEKATIDANQIVRKEIIVRGSLCYTWDDFKESLDLVEDGRVKVDPLISHSFKLSEIDDAMKVIDERKAIKVILYP